MLRLLFAITWTCYNVLKVPFMIAIFLSYIGNCVSLLTVGNRLFPIGLIPCSANFWKLYYATGSRLVSILGVFPSILAVACLVTWNPFCTIAYLVWLGVLNFLFARTMYERPVVFGLFPPYRLFVEIKTFIDSRKE